MPTRRMRPVRGAAHYGSSHSPPENPGERILRDPTRNRDAAFTLEERKRLGLQGMLPPAVLTIQQQVEMELEHIFSKHDPLEQYIGLIALLDRNETLFYRLLVENLDRLTPIIYTPTVGLACQHYSHIYRRPRGLFLCPDDLGHVADRLRDFERRPIRMIVVTDNERILGLGDQGVGGMAIPVGKLILYSAGAGIHPSMCLPVSLDVGTDNQALLDDPNYVGYRKPRLRGAQYDEFAEEFVMAVKHVFPSAVLQWEDFKKANAFRLLHRYEGRLPSFNDDIQGTAAVVLGGMLAALHLLGHSLRDQRLLLVGAGAAGIGIGSLVRAALREEGLPPEDARCCQLFFDSSGVVWEGRESIESHKRDFALSAGELQRLGLPAPPPRSLEEVVRAFRPTILIGTTGQAGDFTSGVIRAMAAGCPRPIILPLSNPTSKAECTPADAIGHSQGRALVATGSPFEPVEWEGLKRPVGQCNNLYIFPGIGLGALISEATRITESMFLTAGRTLAEFTAKHAGESGVLYPGLHHLREISRLIAFRVVNKAREEGCGRSLDDEHLQAEIEASCWFPDYEPLLAGS